MDPRYATFIWACFGIAALAVLWNVFAPQIERRQLLKRLAESQEDEADRQE